MTDPAPSPPAGQPPVPVRPMPRLGGGVHWSAIIAEIEADQARRQAEFKEPAEDLNSSVDDSRKLTSPSELLRDALHVEIRGALGAPPTCDHGTATGTYCWPCAQRDRGTELRAYAAPVEAPPAVELRAMADDLNAHGGLDERFVAGLLQAVAGGSETGGNPSGGPPYTQRYVPPSEDEPPAPSYTYTAPSRRARWLRALDRVRRPR